jgi:hypothetical protein
MPSPTIIGRQKVMLQDRRNVEIVAYSNGELSIHVDDAPFVIAAFDGGEQDGEAAIRLSPGKQGSKAHVNWHHDREAKISGGRDGT